MKDGCVWSKLYLIVDGWAEKGSLKTVTLDDVDIKFPTQAAFRQRLPLLLSKNDASPEITLDFQESDDKQCNGTEALNRDVFRSSASKASFTSAKVQHLCESMESGQASPSKKTTSPPTKFSPSPNSQGLDSGPVDTTQGRALRH